MRNKPAKLIAALLLVVLLLSAQNSRQVDDQIVKAASPPAQQGGSNPSGPELNAAEVVHLFWHEAVSGTTTLNKKEVRRAELGLSTQDAQDPKKIALAFMETQGSQIGLAGAIEITWQPIRVQAEANGVAHVALQQFYNNLPVFAGQVIVHTKDNIGATAANGEYPPEINLSIKPTLSFEAAYKIAAQELSLTDNSVLTEQELLVFNPALLSIGNSANHLAYRFLVGQSSGPESTVIFVDAHTGKILFDYDNLYEARNRLVFDLNNSTGLPGTQCYEESGPISGGSPSTDCTNAYNFTGDTYSYYLNTHSRDSFDDNGAAMQASINYGTTANAFWNGTQTAFGPGFATKDVVAHEWTHAVTQYTADLIYAYQSGALNESMSDIFGAMVDRDDWLMGEDTPIGSLRSLADPNQFGDPKYVSDPLFFCGIGDNGGVHTNSGVPNHTAYLLAEGGSLNGVNVTGVGRNSTEQIFYRALTNYLTSGSNFADTANALNSSCVDLFGSGSSTCASVSSATQATEMTASVCGVVIAADSFEPDDSFAEAVANNRTIATNGTLQSHNFHDAGDNDWVLFTAAAGTDYVIETSNLGSQSDTYMYLYDTNGTTLLAQDDDGGLGRASRIAWTASSNGTYAIRVRHYSSSTFGNNTAYDLSVTGTGSTPTVDPYEVDDSPAQASPLTPNGGTQTHNFHDAGDVDWIRFVAVSNTNYVIETFNLGSQSDTVLELYDLDATTLLVSDDDGGDGLASRIEWVAPASGTYFVRVHHFSPTVFGPNTNYDLRATTTGVAPDSFEPDDIFTQASPITPGGSLQTHNFHDAGDQDWVRFTATASHGYVIETQNLGNQSDTVLELYATNGSTQLAVNDDGGDGLASRIDWTAPTNGTYFVKVRHYSSSAYGINTNYDLGVTDSGLGGLVDAYEDDDTPALATTIIVNDPAQTHNFHDAGDQDWVKFVAQVGVDYTIFTSNLGSTSDTVMVLYDTDATTVIAVNDDSGGSLASRIDWIAPSGGTYYVRIYHYSGNFGNDTNYDLRVIGIGNPLADVYEIDNTPPQATLLNLDTTQSNHNFHEAGDVDWVRFSATADINYIIETLNLGTRSDTVLELYDTDATTLLSFDDDGGGNLASRIAWVAPANGTYYARVRHFSSSTFGANTDYDLRLIQGNTGPGDNYEPDNTFTQASPIVTDGTSQTHNFHIPADVDWVRFSTTLGGAYTIQTLNLGPASDTVLELYDTNGTTLLEVNDDGGVGLASRITWTAPANGTYFVKVRHYLASASGNDTNYDLQVIEGGPNGDPFEPDNTPAQATPLTVNGSSQTHDFHIAGDQDWIEFSTTIGTNYIIETSNLGIASDTYLFLYDTNGTTLLESNDDGGVGLASKIQWTAPANGTYFVKVRHYNNSTYGPDTNYDLAVTSTTGGGGDPFEPDNIFTQANSITVNDAAQTHTFHVTGDNDWVQFSAVAGAEYTVETSNLGNRSDTVIYLYDVDGTTQLDFDDDGGLGLASRIDWVAPFNGIYYVRVRHYASDFVFGADTNYDLRITSDSIIGPDNFEPDNSSTQANPIDVDPPVEVQTHTFHVNGDQDWVQFTGITGETCTIQTLNLGPQSDTFLEFYNNNLTLIASDDDSGPGLASRIVQQIPVGGVTYFTKVRHYSSLISGPGTIYDLTIACTGLGGPDAFEVDNTPAQASTIPTDGTLATHNFHQAGDNDWSRFSATAGTGYIIETSALGSGSDTVMSLYDTDGTTIITSDDDSGVGLASRIIWTAPANGTYFVRVRHFNNSAFGPDTNYNLSVTAVSTLLASAASVELTTPSARVGDEVEALVYLHQPASAIKLEVQAKSTYLDLSEAIPLAKNGQSVDALAMDDADRWQFDTTDEGLASVNYAGKLDWSSPETIPVMRLRWRLTQVLPAAKLSIPFQLTVIDQNGQVTSETFERTLVMIGNEPKIDDVSPKSFTSEADVILSIYGSNFQDTPKVYLVLGNQQIQLIEVEMIDPDPGDPFIRATVPMGTKAGVYKVRVVNPDESSAEYSSVEVLEAGAEGGLKIYLPFILKN